GRCPPRPEQGGVGAQDGVAFQAEGGPFLRPPVAAARCRYPRSLGTRFRPPSPVPDEPIRLGDLANRARSFTGRVSQRRTVKSPEPETSRVLSGLKATAWT